MKTRLIMIPPCSVVITSTAPAHATHKTSFKASSSPATGCGDLPPTQSCVKFTLMIKNYDPTCAQPLTCAWIMYKRSTRHGGDIFVTDAYFTTDENGDRTFDIGSTPCDAATPWYRFVLGPTVIESNVLRTC
jgi:hypothetical protein